jgi:hypothetical protein
VSARAAGNRSNILYTYAGLISAELDFVIADDKRLLPRNSDGSSIGWEAWKKFARELQQTSDPGKIHPRFLIAELKCDTRFVHSQNPDLRIIYWVCKRRLMNKMLVVVTTIAVLVGLTLTAMQVGLATKVVSEDGQFQDISYWFAFVVTFFSLCLFANGLLIYGAWEAITILRRQWQARLG